MNNSLAQSWITGLFLFFGIATLPLYLLPSGGIQISHLLLVIFAGLTFTDVKISWTTAHKILALMAGLALMRESIAGLTGEGHLSGLLQAVMILFNLLILLALYHAAREGRFTKVITFAILGAALIAIVPIAQSGFDFRGSAIQEREIGTFNNPNQLAYFSACLFSIAGLGFATKRIPLAYCLAVLAISLVLTIVSLSKAALFGCGAALIMLGFVFFRSFTARILATSMVLVAAVYFMFQIDFSGGENYKFVLRLMDVGSDHDDNLRNRGYFVLYDGADTILEMFFGLGFKKVLTVLGHEVHSTLAVNFMNYGLVGGTIYLAFIGSWMSRMLDRCGASVAAAILLPPMLYGVAHNGTRFTIFYVLIALTLCWTSGPAASQANRTESF